ncbi:histidine phosphatase family protein [Streptomyces sp. NRRL F-5123]|uniref:histidine phosphatase family protein n=1 Tax=Streptomyces sp. NRRL F-5123 TaxID=1463856 RepID=UPI0004E26EDE|nr:histidine phosphatase family protein [Streptomyces sp. NRRL F-5123]
MGARFLYLVRHGEAVPDESGLSDRGRRQARLLGERLAGNPVSAVWHGPLARARETAEIVTEQLGGAVLRESEVAGDYVPYVPPRDELPAECADFLLSFLAGVTEEERACGARLAKEAAGRFTGPSEGEADVHEVVVTHNFLVGWLVRHALDAPPWRWLGLNHGNASLTVIRYAPGRPTSLLTQNDMGHLPGDLRWTGFSPGVRV